MKRALLAIALLSCVPIATASAQGSEFWEAVRTPGLRAYRRHVAAARTALAARNFQAALEGADAAIASIPTRAEPHVIRAMALAGLSRTAEALAAVRHARELEETSLDAPDNGSAAAMLAAANGDHALAASILSRVLGRMPPQNAQRRALYVFYGDALLATGEGGLRDAIGAYREGSRAQGAHDFRALVGLALALRRQGERAEALEVAREIAGAGPQDALIAALPIPDTEKAARRAVALEAAGDLAAAREAWTQAAQGGPWAASARQQITLQDAPAAPPRRALRPAPRTGMR